MVNKICDEVFQNIPWWYYNRAIVTTIECKESCQDKYMYYDIVKGGEHANVKEGGFSPMIDKGVQWLTNVYFFVQYGRTCDCESCEMI